METKTCHKCEQDKPVSEFYRHHRRGYQSMCKACKAAYNREHYRNNIEAYKQRAKEQNKRHRPSVAAQIVDYLELHPCVECGNDDVLVLEFHHLDPAEKDFTIGNAVAKRRLSWKRVQREIEKCQVLCANCHKRKTAKAQNTQRYQICRARSGITGASKTL